MISSILTITVNNAGLPRLTKFYIPVDLVTQKKLVEEIHELVSKRPASHCNFLTPPSLLDDLDDIRVIYRHYATLYFVFVVDTQESELGILDLIQVFVESLDHCFENVCELDLVFGWEVLQIVLGEIVQGGMVVETNIQDIVACVDEANRQKSSGLSLVGSANAISALAEEGRNWAR
ncbi:hypothetical protein CANCADRAFT_13162, partial [Tortispora caseinolytica NRRL Y-17796]